MKTVILYATKHGTTRAAATRIADALAEQGLGEIPNIIDLKSVAEPPDLTEYDCIILGSAIYAGQVRKEMTSFLSSLPLSDNGANLKEKTWGIYLCGLDPSKEEQAFKTNFPDELLNATKAKTFLGGMFDPKSANFAERMIIKAVAKTSDSVDTLDKEKIAKFAQELGA